MCVPPRTAVASWSSRDGTAEGGPAGVLGETRLEWRSRIPEGRPLTIPATALFAGVPVRQSRLANPNRLVQGRVTARYSGGHPIRGSGTGTLSAA